MRSNRTLTHEQARSALQAAADGALDPALQPALERHLAGCPQCQRYARALAGLAARLAAELPAAYPAQPGNEPQVASTLEKIHAQKRHTPMKHFLSNTARTVGLGLAAILLVAGLAWGIRTLRPIAIATQPAQQLRDTPATTAEGSAAAPAPTAPATADPAPTPQSVAPEEAQAARLGTTVGLFPTTRFDFPAGYPAAPETVQLYQLQLPEPVTPQSALQTAARLGVNGWVYSQPSEGFDQTVYEVTDGFELLRFINFAEQFVFETSHTDPLYSGGEPLPYAERLPIATDYLNRYGLLDQPYQASDAPIEPGVVVFTPLLEQRRVIYGNGQNPGNLEWISVQVNAQGEVSRVMFSQQRFAPLGEAPILSAEQAWQRLSAENAKQHSYYAVMPAEQINTYHVWKRSYPLGQPVDLYGYVYVRHPVDPADPTLVSFGDYPVSNGEALESLDPGTNIHAWGQFIQDESGHLLFEISEWEISRIVEEYYEGTLQRDGDQGLLVTRQGTLILPELPADIPDGWQVFATGLLQPGDPAVLDWFQITGGNYPNSYYTARSCGGFGGGGGGETENVNFGSGSFTTAHLQPVSSPTATPEPGPYPTGELLSGISGRIYAIRHLYADGTTILELNITTDSTGESPYGGFFRLQGAATAGLEQYQSLPVRIWGQVSGSIEYTPVITLERWEPQYPGLVIQQWNGTEAILNLEGQDVVVLTADSGEAFVLQSSLTWGAEGNLIGRLGDYIEIEGYTLPDRTFGGYPVIQDLSGGLPPDGEITSGKIDVYDHTFEAPDVNTLMAGQVTIDSIELAYASITLEHCLSSHATNPDMLPYLTVQPVWIYTGHFADGRVIVIQVQALPEEYLQ